jgi:hypothetical protein
MLVLLAGIVVILPGANPDLGVEDGDASTAPTAGPDPSSTTPTPATAPAAGGLIPDSAVCQPPPAGGTSGGADASSTAIGPGTRGSTKVIMTTGFEFANDHDFPMNYPLWEVRDDNPQNGTDFWDDSTARPHNGARSMYCADNGSGPAFGYDNGMTAWMTYGPFNLTNATQAHLKFWYWFDLDEGNDTLGFYGSPNGTSFTGFYFPGQNSSGWQYYSYDLSNYTGQEDSLCGEPQAWVAFRFFSNGAIAGNESFEGAYIDDVTIDEYTNLPPDAAGLNVTGDRWRVVDPTPTFNWTFLDTDIGDSQTARHIQVGDDSNWGDTDGIGGGPAEMWDSNATSAANAAGYAGFTMADGTTYHARVKVRDGDLAWSDWTEFSFATNDPPSDFAVTEPAAGAIVNGSIGNFAHINWTIPTNDDYGTDDNITVNLSYSDDGGQTWNSISDGENNTGSYLVNISLSLESSQMLIRVTAWDGYEERANTSSLFTVDSKPPVFNDIKVFSNTSWYFVSKKAPTSLMVWFNSLAGQGANQQFGIRVNWSDASRESLTGLPAFGDNPVDDDSNPNLVNYTIEQGALFTTVELKIMDHFGRFSMLKVSFYDDNLHDLDQRHRHGQGQRPQLLPGVAGQRDAHPQDTTAQAVHHHRRRRDGDRLHPPRGQRWQRRRLHQRHHDHRPDGTRRSRTVVFDPPRRCPLVLRR